MTFDSLTTTYIIQCVPAASLCAISTVCILLTTTGGRKLLKRINDFSKRHPVKFLVFFAIYVRLISWAGDKPPGPVVVEKGITLNRVMQTPEKVRFEWTADDARIGPGATFKIQEYNREGMDWIDLGTTTNTVYEFRRFTVNKDNRWRIAVDIGDGE